MIETEMQQLLIDAAKSVGGQGLKLNNRFVVGVVDLLISIPGCRPVWLEAKRLDLSAKSLAAGHHISDIGCTYKQQKFLYDWHAAGMLTGVASFIQEPGKGVKSLRLALYAYDDMLKRHWTGHSRDHEPIGDHRTRMSTLAEMLQLFAEK